MDLLRHVGNLTAQVWLNGCRGFLVRCDVLALRESTEVHLCRGLFARGHPAASETGQLLRLHNKNLFRMESARGVWLSENGLKQNTGI